MMEFLVTSALCNICNNNIALSLLPSLLLLLCSWNCVSQQHHSSSEVIGLQQQLVAAGDEGDFITYLPFYLDRYCCLGTTLLLLLLGSFNAEP